MCDDNFVLKQIMVLVAQLTLLATGPAPGS